MFLMRSGVYRSDKPTPTLTEALDAAEFAILYLLAARADKNQSMDSIVSGARHARKLMRQTLTWLESPENNATKLVGNGIIRPTTWAPEASESLETASAFYWEAKTHQSRGDIERSWAALLQCHFYIGQASGPESLRERSSKAGQTQAKAFREFRRELLKWLAELEGLKFESIAAVVSYLEPKAKKYWADRVPPATEQDQGASAQSEDESSRRRSSNPKRTMTKWASEDEQVKEAFARLLVDGKPKRGRRKGARSGAASD